MDCEFKLGSGARPFLCSLYKSGEKNGMCKFQRYCMCNKHYKNTENMISCKLRNEALAAKQAEEETAKPAKKQKKKTVETPVAETSAAENNIISESNIEE